MFKLIPVLEYNNRSYIFIQLIKIPRNYILRSKNWPISPNVV